MGGCTKFKSFDFHDHKCYELENDIDPEIHFYQNFNVDREYYSEEKFNANVKMEGFSVIHFNSRSLHSNFAKIKDYLNQLQQRFTVIAISETWLRDSKELLDGLEGYEMFWQNRIDKRGGGVALFVMSSLKCKVIGDMTTVIDNLMECVTIEIIVERSKNILISCIYRTPGTCIDQFNKKIYELYERHHDKVILVCGDFNIDLMKFNDHTKTTDFVNLMFSLSFYPLIVKPSRITKDSLTLIDNIFINVFDGKRKSGLLLTDVSDHLPVFTVIEMNNKLNLQTKRQVNNLVRMKSPEAIKALKADLSNHDWQEVFVENTNEAYDAFLDTFLTLYDRHCPLREYRQNTKKREKLWLTKGLIKACKKKNRLYREFIKHRTKEKEDKYKKYKNRLTWIMRLQQKNYYEQLLNKHTNNIIATWSVLNDMIKKSSKRDLFYSISGDGI